MGVGCRGCPGSSRPSAQHRQDRPLRVPCAVRTCVSGCPRHAPEERGAAGGSLAGRRAGGRREDEPMSTSESRKPSHSLGFMLPAARRVCHVFKSACLGLGTERTYNARASCVVLQRCVRPGLWGLVILPAPSCTIRNDVFSEFFAFWHVFPFQLTVPLIKLVKDRRKTKIADKKIASTQNGGVGEGQHIFCLEWNWDMSLYWGPGTKWTCAA